MSAGDLLSLSGRRGTPYVPQSEASECGLACLVMVAGHHGYQADFFTLRRRFGVSLKGATLKQLIDTAEAMGFSARPLRGELSDLLHLSLPAILHWDLKHFVVLHRVTRGFGGDRFHIHDPARGSLVLSTTEVSRHFTGVALELVKSETFRPRSERVQLGITQLWSSISGFGRTARSIFVLSLLLQLAALAAPFYLQIAIDTVAPAADRDLLLMLALGFGGLAAISLAAKWLRGLILLNLSNTLSYQIVVNLFRHLMRLPLPWFEKRHVGDVVSRFGATQPITQLLSEGLIASMIDGVMAVLTLALMFVYSPLLAGLALLTLVTYGGVRVAFLKLMRLRNVDAITKSARESSLFIESVRGVAAIKAFGKEGTRQRIWQQAKADAVNASIKVGRMSAGFDAFGQFVVAAERVAFVYVAVSMALEAKITVGMIFAFQSYKQQFLDAGMRLVEQSVNYNMLKVQMGRLADIVLSKTEDDGRALATSAPTLEGIEARGVRFRYGSGEREVLRGVDLHVPPGSMVALVGPSGGGKTTLLRILMGLFEPGAGQVLVGGQPMAGFSKTAFRGRIGSVAQDDLLYAGSLADNISFFDPEFDMDRVAEVARLAAIDQEIEAMPLRYDTLVGDMGSALSGGQKQRVLLARALYGRPDILFMDEGTANLDPVSEQKVTAALRSLPITRVLVAHRSALIQASDVVYVVEDGRIHAPSVKAAVPA